MLKDDINAYQLTTKLLKAKINKVSEFGPRKDVRSVTRGKAGDRYINLLNIT